MFTTKERNTLLGLVEREQATLRCNPHRDVSSAKTQRDLVYLGHLWNKVLSLSINDHIMNPEGVNDSKATS